ncbi:hypothetical protein BU17DRAFT_47491 [Hysterangium stoloniferum]|nr:hypothetical protein BU17DRAFT_47491 [Hysterangium stoloniferum]
MISTLPFPNGGHSFQSQSQAILFLRRRRNVVLASFIALVVLYWLYRSIFTGYEYLPTVRAQANKFELDHPATSPTYDQIRAFERHLPQHNLSLASPEGRHGRFIRFSNEVWSYGLNNQLQDRMLHMHLAFLSNRAYVFTDVTFTENFDYKNHNDWHPLNTFINGPTAGGPLPPVLAAAGVPRAVTRDYFEDVCPANRRTIVKVEDIHAKYGMSHESDGLPTLENWVKELRDMPDLCVEIHPHSPHVFDFPLINSRKILSLFSSFSTSPAVSDFTWSQTVRYAVSHNLPIITSTNSSATLGSSGHHPSSTSLSMTESLSDVLALHIRRGDFEHHCYGIANNGWSYNSWNQLPTLPDKYFAPHSMQDGPELVEFLRHCWPSVEEIVERVRGVKREYERLGGGRRLRKVYVLSNAKRPWVQELKDALMGAGMGWEGVAGSRDLVLRDGPERMAAQATDMAIASKAAVLLGNGFSTLTANVVLFRLADGFAPETCRFW